MGKSIVRVGLRGDETLMIKEINKEFQTKYPKLYITAESYGYTIDQIDFLFNIVSSHNMYNVSYNEIEQAMKSMIIRHEKAFGVLVEGIKRGEYDLSTLAGKSFWKVSDVLLTYIQNDNTR